MAANIQKGVNREELQTVYVGGSIDSKSIRDYWEQIKRGLLRPLRASVRA